MKVNELRIGNFILLNNEVDYITGIWCQFNGGNIDDYFVQNSGKMDYLLSKIEPVPLTEEWLLKFGFETDMIETNTYYFLDFNNIERILWHNNSCIYGILGVSQYEWSNIKINYVHQLQNLYFALSGLEFEIK